MKILLAIDDSKYSKAAAQAVIRQMRPEGADVCVFHVVVPLVIIPYGYMGQVETLEAAQQERLKEGKELGERTAQQLRASGFQVHVVVEEGDPKTAILEKAAEWTADVIFMGSHGRKGIDRFLTGSTSQAVLRHAHCSVEIVRMRRQSSLTFTEVSFPADARNRNSSSLPCNKAKERLELAF